MLLKLENYSLVPIAGLLGGIPLSGRASRGRTKLIKLLDDKIKDVQVYQEELVGKYLEKNNVGEPESFTYKDEESEVAYNKELIELVNDLSTINLTEYSTEMKALLEGLLDTEVKFKEEEAFMYDKICEGLEMGLEE